MTKTLTGGSVSQRELGIARVFDAPREQVWKAWTEPERVKRWWGPKVFTAPVIKIDLRAGGKYLYCMRGPDGKDYWSTGVYREIIAPEKMVVSDSFADKDGNVVPAEYYGMSGFPLETQVTVSFEEHGGRTRLIIGYPDVSGMGAKHLADMQQGWNESLDKLAEMLTDSLQAVR